MAYVKQYRSDPLTEREKAYLRRLNGTKQPFSVDAPAPEMKKVREYQETIKVVLPKRRKLGTSGCRLSPELRAIVEARGELRTQMRASLEAVIDGRKKELPL